MLPLRKHSQKGGKKGGDCFVSQATRLELYCYLLLAEHRSASQKVLSEEEVRFTKDKYL